MHGTSGTWYDYLGKSPTEILPVSANDGDVPKTGPIGSVSSACSVTASLLELDALRLEMGSDPTSFDARRLEALDSDGIVGTQLVE